MTRRAEIKNAFSRGCLDPELFERGDLKHYALALRDATNCVIPPKGGLKRRPGTIATKRRLRRQLEPIALNAAMVTLHNGGVAANIVDQDSATLFTTSAVAANPFVVVEFDLGASQKVTFVDVIGFFAQSKRADDALVVEHSNGGAWTEFVGSGDPSLSPRRNIRVGLAQARTRRFGNAPGQDVTARYIRIVIKTSVATGTITVSSVRMWREQSARSVGVDLVPAAKTATEAYEIALTDRNGDVFRNGRYYASFPLPHPGEIIEETDFEQSLDTLFVFHEDIAFPAVVRQGAHDEWNSAAAALENVSDLTPSTAFSGDADEVQDLTFTGFSNGQTFFLFLEGAHSAPVVFPAGDAALLATRVASALEGLPGVADGVEASVVQVSPPIIRVAFTELNGARRWPPVYGRAVEPSTGRIATAISQRGLLSTGPLMGATTGWPRCGAIVQSRLLLGGFRSAPKTFYFSKTGDPYNFSTGGSSPTASSAFFNTLDSDEVETIHRVYVGQNIHLFTDRGEWWIENRTIDATEPTNVVVATRYGAAPRVPVIFAESGVCFIQAGEEADGVRQPNTVLRQMSFSGQSDRNNYSSEPLSLIGGHLLTDVIDMAHRPGVTTKEASLVLLVNSDDTFAMLTLLMGQEVYAMTPGATAGKIRSVMVSASRQLWAAVERGPSNAREIYLERFDDAAVLDAQTAFSGGPLTVVTGLEHFNGLTVYAIADGDVQGPFTVSGGQITLTTAATAGVVGLWPEIAVRTLPLRESDENRQPFRPPYRVYEVEFSLLDCGPFQMRANGGAWRDAPLRLMDGRPHPRDATGEEFLGDTIDTPMMLRLYTGHVRLEGLTGFSRNGDVELRQTAPAPFYLRAIRYQAVS